MPPLLDKFESLVKLESVARDFPNQSSTEWTPSRPTFISSRTSALLNELQWRVLARMAMSSNVRFLEHDRQLGIGPGRMPLSLREWRLCPD